MKSEKIKEILIPKGYDPEDILDIDDEGFDFDEAVLSEEVKLVFE